MITAHLSGEATTEGGGPSTAVGAEGETDVHLVRGAAAHQETLGVGLGANGGDRLADEETFVVLGGGHHAQIGDGQRLSGRILEGDGE